MKDSCMRIVLILCSVILLIIPNTLLADEELGPPFKFEFATTFIPEGTVGCVDVVVEGFENVMSFEFGITFDTNIFEFSSVQSDQFAQTEIFGNVNPNANGQDVLTIIFFDFDGTTTLPDGTVAFTVCFEALTNDGDATTLMFSDLANGNPSQIFVDNNGTVESFQEPDLCVVGSDVIIGSPPMAISITTTTQGTTCQSSEDGVLEIDITGGLEPYNLLVTDCNTGDIIRGPEQVGISVVLTDLDVGDYCIEVSDNMVPSTVETAMATVTNNGPTISARFEIMEPSCNGFDDGSIQAFAILDAVEQPNPNNDFNFVWTVTGGQGSVVDNTIDNIGAGNYEIQVSEIASGCSVTLSTFLTEPTPVVVDIDVTDETCGFGGMDGEVAAVTTGGVGGYTFLWDDANTSTDSIVSNLSAGLYTVNVRDANGCLGIDTDEVMIPMPPAILGFDSVSISCPNAMDGELEVLFTQGTANIDRVEWIVPGGNTAMGPRITNLGPGQYLAQVFGIDNCVSSLPVTLGEPDGVMIDLDNSSTTLADCPDFNNGTIAIAATGGTPPYTIILDGVAQTPGVSSFNGFTDGDYMISVMDANGCETVPETFTVPRAPDITVEFIDIQGVLCANGLGGGATIVPMGGLGPYFYIWENGETDSIANSLIGGIDSVQIVSGNCFLDTFVVVPQPDEIMIAADISMVNCFGDSDGQIDLSLSGGTGDFTVTSSVPANGTVLEDLEADFYTIVVSDENNCQKSVTVEVAQPDSLDAFIADVQDITCSGEADGLLVAAVEGGTGNPVFEWSTGPNDIFNTNTGLFAGDYIVTVTDENGCIDTAMATIVEPMAISAVIPPIPEAPCFNEQTVISVTQVTGGNGAPYAFTINAGPAVPINSPIPVFAGEYTVTVFDNRGCRQAFEVVATEPPPIQVNAGIDQEINLGGSTFVFGSANSVVGIDSIFWLESPGDSTLSCYDCLTPTASPLEDSFYELVVRDLNGCVASDEVFINVDSDRNVFVPNAFTPYKVDGFNDFFSPFTGIGVENVVSMEIFDRWGELVFLNENFLPGNSEAGGWDGKFRGKIASKGVYFYIINVQFIDGVVLTYRGTLNLL